MILPPDAKTQESQRQFAERLSNRWRPAPSQDHGYRRDPDLSQVEYNSEGMCAGSADAMISCVAATTPVASAPPL